MPAVSSVTNTVEAVTDLIQAPDMAAIVQAGIEAASAVDAHAVADVNGKVDAVAEQVANVTKTIAAMLPHFFKLVSIGETFFAHHVSTIGSVDELPNK